jgi:hypothetical protein
VNVVVDIKAALIIGDQIFLTRTI